MKNGLKFHFDSEAFLNYPPLNIFSIELGSSGHSGLGANATHVLGHPEYRSCVVAHYPPPTQAYPRLETEEPCPQSLPGLCMRKLARGCAER